jgi:hypothetical protein
MSTAVGQPSPIIITEASHSPVSLKMGMAIVGCLILIYIIFRYKKFSDSPMGKALGTILTAAEKMLTALASLPPWLLIGLVCAGLFGEAIMKMGASSVLALGKAADAINDALETVEPESVEAVAKSAASQLHENVRVNEANSNATNEERQANATDAVTDNAQVQADLRANGLEMESEKGMELADNELPVVEVKT